MVKCRRADILQGLEYVERQSFVYYRDWWEAVRTQSPELRLEITDALLDYAFMGVLPKLSGSAQMAINFIKNKLDRDTKKYREIQKKRVDAANSRWKDNECTSKQKDAHACNSMQVDYVSVNDNVNVIKESTNVPKKKFSLPIPQSEEEFKGQLKPYVERYGQPMIKSFFLYWSELSKDGKMKVQHEKSWELGKRLARWANNNYNKQ